MKQRNLLTVSLGALVVIALLAMPLEALAQQRQGGTAYSFQPNSLAQVTHLVDQWERAYQKKDKQTMLFKLMAPSQDPNAIEKRYQWFRGYGPKDMPGTAHQPDLFDTKVGGDTNYKGSFVPTSYALTKTTKISPTLWDATVEEKGAYHDENGRYKVTRVRHIKAVKINGKWYVADYYLASNPEDYGFYVDDISDKMTKIAGK